MRNKGTTYRVFRDMTPVTVGGASAASAEVSPQVFVVRLFSTTDCHIAFDAAATTNSTRMAAGAPEYFAVSPGQTVNVIQNSAGGTLYVTEMSA